MNRTLRLIKNALLIGMAAFILYPLIGPLPFDQAVNSSASRGAFLFVLMPWFLITHFHNSGHVSKKKRNLMNFFFAISFFAAIAAIALIRPAQYILAMLAALISWLLLYCGCRILYRPAPSPKEIIITEGERILAEETDPIEARKFKSALERFKKS